MIRTQTIKAVLASSKVVPIEFHENGTNDIVVAMAFEPVVRGVLPLLQWLPTEIPSGQRGLTARQALEQAWRAVQTIVNKHNDSVAGLEIDSYELLPQVDVLASTGDLPITRI